MLASRPLLRANDERALRDSLWAGYGAELRKAPAGDRPFFALANRIELGGVTLHYCRYDTPVDIRFTGMAGVRQFHCFEGEGEIRAGARRAAIGSATTTILPADSSFDAAYGHGYQHIVSQFDEQALRRKAEAITGLASAGTMDFPALEPLEVGARVRSRQIVWALGRILSSPGGAIDHSVLEMAQALSSAFLMENVPGFAQRLAIEPVAAGRRSVAALEDYIQENWNQPLTVEAIAAACNVSVRSVFARFKAERGVAPLTYIRGVRLDNARRMLLSGAEDVSVISVAMRCGFSSFGHFARRYRERFGELPSATRPK